MTPLDDEALRAIIAGCEGVTPGPWSLQPIGRMAMAVIAANRIVIHSFDSAVELDGGQRTDKILSDARRQERDGFATLEADAAYIARLDPDTVRALATQALEVNRMRETLETGWLIERADSSPPWPWYWAAWRETSARRSAWTQNPEQAIRFARREDAERTQRRLFKDIRVRVCEHAWDAPALTPSTGTREDELREALTNARSMLITLAGDPRKFIAEDRGGMGDKTQAALLDQLDNALARITEGTPKP